MTTSTTPTVTEELRRWIVAQAEAGCRPEDVLAARKSSGWDEEIAIDAMEQTMSQRLDELGKRTTGAGLPAASKVPEPAVGEGALITLSDGHQVKILTSMKLPRVVVFGSLMTDAECEGLMALAAPRLLRSETVDNATGGSEVNAART